MTGGIVYLVGAGPGDPGLLTVRAAELIRTAEVLAHDELIPEPILALAPPTAERLAVGRRRGDRPRPSALHPEVLARAHAGKRVVRLKAGDSFVFGRGAEEAEALAEAGIPFEIIPGITAAAGAAAYAGIPLTDRRLASHVTLTTGHAGAAPTPAAAGAPGTLVVYMATHNLAENLAGLVAQGHPGDTPAAYVSAATHRDQRVFVGTLSTLAAQVAGLEGKAPALVIVGEVVKLRRKLAWLERRPLAGRHVVVARARPGDSQVATELRRLGAEVCEAPAFQVGPPDTAELDAALLGIDRFGAVVFACEAGVEATLDRLQALGISEAVLRKRPVIAVGPCAAARLRQRGLPARVELKGSCADELARHRARLALAPLLVVTAERGRPGLLADLTALGATVRPVAAYRLVRNPVALPAVVDAVVLPSSTAADHLFADPAAAPLLSVPMVAMGPRTFEAAQRLGAQGVRQAPQDTPTALVGATLALLAPQAAQRSIRSSSVVPRGERARGEA
jgi:uroporphyrinogen III methyltransferase/synthase